MHSSISLLRTNGRRYRGEEVAWQYVGSHNLSKAAWGQLQKNNSQLMCRRCAEILLWTVLATSAVWCWLLTRTCSRCTQAHPLITA